LAAPTPPPWKIAGILTIGMFAIATAAILIRCASGSVALSHPGLNERPGFSFLIAASRMGLATLILSGSRRMQSAEPIPWHNSRAIQRAAIAGVALALHFASWVTSLNYTSITASTVLVTTTPIWTALICGLILKEKISRATNLGITIAFLGGLTIATDNSASLTQPQAWLGNSLALAGAMLATCYLLVGRSAQRQGLSTSQYSLLAYGTAAMVLLPLPGLAGVGFTGYPPLTYGWLLIMAIVPQLLGHTSFNWAIRYIAPNLVTLAILAEPIGASLLGYLIFREIPTPQTLIGSGIILFGITIASLNNAPKAA
jgi:drug/metabolite transporter (DMT)-like permease